MDVAIPHAVCRRRSRQPVPQGKDRVIMTDDTDILPEDRVGYAYTTRGRTIAESDILLHAGQTGDQFPLHMDAEAAAGSRYGQRVAHGTLTLSIALGLKYDTDQTKGVRISYGYDRVRYRGPVFIGDTIRAHVEVTGSEMDPKRPGVRRVVEKTEVVNQRGETVLSLDHILIRWT
jgi:monoamine oxidase